jgi:RNA binding exosome subunit
MHVNRFVEFFGKKIKPRLKFASRELTNKERTMAIKVLGILGKYGLRFEDLDKVITDIESFYGNPFAILHANFRANPFDKELSIISELFKACKIINLIRINEYNWII